MSAARRWGPWFAALGGPDAWIVHAGARYPLVPYACAADRLWTLHAVTAACALTAVLALVAALRSRRDDDRGLRFLASAGLALDPLFLLVILAEWAPALWVDPCS